MARRKRTSKLSSTFAETLVLLGFREMSQGLHVRHFVRRKAHLHVPCELLTSYKKHAATAHPHTRKLTEYVCVYVRVYVHMYTCMSASTCLARSVGGWAGRYIHASMRMYVYAQAPSLSLSLSLSPSLSLALSLSLSQSPFYACAPPQAMCGRDGGRPDLLKVDVDQADVRTEGCVWCLGVPLVTEADCEFLEALLEIFEPLLLHVEINPLFPPPYVTQPPRLALSDSG